MKKLGLIFCLAILSSFIYAQYSGTPFYDYHYAVGDYVEIWLFDKGPKGEVAEYTALPGGNFAQGSNQRGDALGDTIRCNTSNRTIRNFATATFDQNEDFFLRYTYYLYEGKYILKFIGHNAGSWRDFTIYVKNADATSDIDTLTPSRGTGNAFATGEATAIGSREWFIDTEDTLVIPNDNLYVLEFDIPLSNQGYLGTFCLYPAFDGADLTPPTITTAPDVVVPNEEFQVTSNEDGYIAIVKNNILTSNSTLSTPGYGVVSKAAISNDAFIIDSRGAGENIAQNFSIPEIGDYFIYAVDATGNISDEHELNVADLIAPNLYLHSHYETDYPDGHFRASMDESGTIYLVPDTATKDDDLASIAYITENYSSGGGDAHFYIDVLDVELLPSDFLLFGEDESGNVSDSIVVTVKYDNIPPVLELISDDSVSIPQPFVVSLNEDGNAFLVEKSIPKDSIRAFAEEIENGGGDRDWIFGAAWLEPYTPDSINTTFLGMEGPLPDTFLIYGVDRNANVSDSILVYAYPDLTPPPSLIVHDIQASYEKGDTIMVETNKSILTFMAILAQYTAEQVVDSFMMGNEDFTDSVIGFQTRGDFYVPNVKYPLIISQSTKLDDYKIYALDANFAASPPSSTFAVTDTRAPWIKYEKYIEMIGTPINIEANESCMVYLCNPGTAPSADFESVSLESVDIAGEYDSNYDEWVWEDTISTYGIADGRYILYAVDYEGNVSDSNGIQIGEDTEPPVLQLTSSDNVVVGEPFTLTGNEDINVLLAREDITSDSIATIDFEQEDWEYNYDWVYAIAEIPEGMEGNLSTSELVLSGASLPDTFLIFGMDRAGNLADSIVVYVDEDPSAAPVLTVKNYQANFERGDTIIVSADKNVLDFLMTYSDITAQQIIDSNMAGNEDWVDSVIIESVDKDVLLANVDYHIILEPDLPLVECHIFAVDANLQFSTVSQAFNIVDTRAPKLEFNPMVTEGEHVYITSNEVGNAYIVSIGTNANVNDILAEELASDTLRHEWRWDHEKEMDVEVIRGSINTDGIAPGNYLVYAIDGVDNVSMAYNLTIVGLPGIEQQESLTLTIEPTLANDYITIKSNSNIGNYAIYSATGKLIVRSTYSTERINVADYESGLYIIAVQNQNGSYATAKFIKQ